MKNRAAIVAHLNRISTKEDLIRETEKLLAKADSLITDARNDIALSREAIEELIAEED